MKIQVAVDHIRRGQQEQYMTCPGALACAEAGYRGAFVALNRLIYRPADGPLFLTSGKTLRLPLSARRFISQFDAGEMVRPFSFELEAP